jgi:ribosomal protein L10
MATNDESYLKKKIDLYAMFLKEAYRELNAYRCFLYALVEQEPHLDVAPLLTGFLDNEVVRVQSEKKLAELDSLLDKLASMSPDEVQEELRKWTAQHSPAN